MADTILVTGGAGYVGSHVVVELAKAGYAPVVLDNFANSTPAVLPRLQALAGRPIPSVTADVRDAAALRAVFHDHPIAAVVHCAGLKAVGESQERPLAYYDVNVGGAIALAEVMGEAGVATLVFSSSATVYGQPDHLPVPEDAPLRPHSVYGRTKRVVEDFLRDLAKANDNWRIAILRYFNPAGAHSSGMLGEASRGKPANLVPLLCKIAAGELAELAIYGGDWPTADGTGVRDYLHVQDLAEGHVAAMRYLAKAHGAHTLNLGAGRGHSVMEVVAAFEKACGRTIAKAVAPRRPGDVAAYYADPARAAKLLEWRASRDLQVICADAWRWQRNGGRY
ncbi:MAG: UDP-glucose 4-epimerase GalE [Burkholderiales bacterium]|nr:UDP-glucose 4-epimerase GalE [Burkholderiales bacterium]